MALMPAVAGCIARLRDAAAVTTPLAALVAGFVAAVYGDGSLNVHVATGHGDGAPIAHAYSCPV